MTEGAVEGPVFEEREGWCPVAPRVPGYPGVGGTASWVTYRPCWHGDPENAPHPVGTPHVDQRPPAD